MEFKQNPPPNVKTKTVFLPEWVCCGAPLLSLSISSCHRLQRELSSSWEHVRSREPVKKQINCAGNGRALRHRRLRERDTESQRASWDDRGQQRRTKWNQPVRKNIKHRAGGMKKQQLTHRELLWNVATKKKNLQKLAFFLYIFKTGLRDWWFYTLNPKTNTS